MRRFWNARGPGCKRSSRSTQSALLGGRAEGGDDAIAGILKDLVRKQREGRQALRGWPPGRRGDAPISGASQSEIELDKALVVWLGYNAVTVEGRTLELLRSRAAFKRAS